MVRRYAEWIDDVRNKIVKMGKRCNDGRRQDKMMLGGDGEKGSGCRCDKWAVISMPDESLE